MTELVAAGWVATPQEVIHNLQIFWWVHLPFTLLWIHKHWFTGRNHQAIRRHHHDDHGGSPFGCPHGDCALL